jgi:peptidoglycan/xylan/chitin deacetylase (PgdA/CDA1 family)
VKRMLAGLAAAASALALAGCAAPFDPAWTPPSWPAATVATVTAPEPLDAADVPGLRGQRLRNDTVGLQSRVALLPGDASVNAAVLDEVRARIADRASKSGTRYRPEVFAPGAGLGQRDCAQGSTLRSAADILQDPELGPAGGSGSAVVCDIVLAAGTFLGQRIRLIDGDAAAVALDEVSLRYADTATGEFATAGDLWTQDAPVALWSDIVDVLRREHGALSLAPVRAPEEAGLASLRAALDTTLVGPGGALVIRIPAGFTAPELVDLGVDATTEAMSIGIPPEVARELLTPFAAAMTDAVAAGAAYVPPPTVPAGLETIDCDLVPCVGMTYDDGPSQLTAAVLDAAAQRDVAVTFFSMGQNARRYPDLLRRAVSEGHLVENHTWNHPQLTDIPGPDVTTQIRDTNAAVQAATGVAPTLFRPPYGEYDAEVLARAGMPAILWDVDTLDWEGPDDDELIRRAVTEPKPGSIVLQHDIHANTTRTAGAVYDGLADRGFELVNLRQLFGGTLPTSGAYRSAR